MHHNYKISNTFNVTGRGTIFIIDLGDWVDDSPINVGDTISNNNQMYQITAIDAIRNTFNGKINPMIGLAVKPIVND